MILMDCEMPVMDGLEATRRIREIEAMASGLPGEASARTPIIAVTAHALGEVRDRCLRAGMDDFLVKPFDERQVAETLRRWLLPVDIDAEQRLPLPNAIIDAAVIESLRALDAKRGSSRLERAVSQFTSIAPPLAATIHEKFSQGDTEALWRAAHSLKSSAGALGARQLSQRCADIESAARNEGIEQVRPLVGPLDGELEVAIKSLQELIGSPNAPA